MSTASIDLQGTAHPVLDTDPHPATSHLNDLRAWVRYARDLTQYGIERADVTRGDMVALGTGFTIVFTALIAMFA